MDKVIDETTSFHFTIIDNYILDSEKLDGMEQITYVHLKKYSASSCECFPGIATLSKKLRCSQNTVRRTLRSLESKGLISIQRRFNNSNQYKLMPITGFMDEFEKLSTDNNNGIADVISFYQNNINPAFGSMERESLISWFDTFQQNSDLIIKAVSIAISENVRKLKYVEAILRDWHENGIKTVEQAESYIKLRSQKHNDLRGKKEDTFNNYEQRTYDFKELERKLLGRT